MKPRPHQVECLQKVKAENTIVNMPTGTGKTLVAVLAIDHFRSSGKVLFLVPTRPLVGQQAEYVRKNCERPVAVAELQGATTDNLTAAEWGAIVSSADVLVGTAEVFRRALVDTKYLHIGQFSLLIFDECHNAVGNSPMAAIMRDAVHRSTGHGPRILGLTASFVNGSLAGIAQKRKDLEGLLQSKVFCPDVEERAMEFERVDYDVSVLPAMEEVVKGKVEALMGVAQRCGVPLKETQATIRRGVHVFSELGVAAFIYFLRECVAPQIQAHLENLAGVLPLSGQQQGARNAAQNMAQLRQAMQDAANHLSTDGELTRLPYVTDKASKLLALATSLYEEKRDKRVIVFCEQTVLAHPLAHLLQEHLAHLGCKAGTCTGVGSMTDGQRKQALQNFRSGQVPLMTCTAALEEGLDVSECEVVIRFSSFKTTKSHIQGAGRARKWNARVFYFENDPDKEIEGAELLECVAKAAALSLTDAEMQQRRAHSDVAGVHPYRTGGGAEISIFNGVQLVYEYAAKTMGQSFRPEESMLQYKEEVVCTFPLQKKKKLVGATIPSPNGFFDIAVDAVDTMWGNVSLDDVAEKSRIKNWDGQQKELRRFMYVVAVTLSQMGLFDVNNQPSARALRETKHACASWQMSPGVSIGVKYDPRGLLTSAAPPPAAPTALPPMAGAGGSSGSTAPPVSPSLQSPSPTSPSPAAAAPGGGQPRPPEAAGAPTDNFKGLLNERTHSGASYTTIEDNGLFVSTVVLPDGRSFQGVSHCLSKKAAEQHAAELALRALGDEPCPPKIASILGLAPAAPLALAPLQPSTQAGEGRQNFKGMLNEMTHGKAVYKSWPVPGGFLAEVTLPDGRTFCSSSPASTKKEAEQLAAEAAVSSSSTAAGPCGGMGGAAARPTQGSTVAPPTFTTAQSLAVAPSAAPGEDLLSRLYAALAEEQALPLMELARRVGQPKEVVDTQLQELQKRGLAKKVMDSPPIWAVA